MNYGVPYAYISNPEVINVYFVSLETQKTNNNHLIKFQRLPDFLILQRDS